MPCKTLKGAGSAEAAPFTTPTAFSKIEVDMQFCGTQHQHDGLHDADVANAILRPIYPGVVSDGTGDNFLEHGGHACSTVWFAGPPKGRAV